MIAQSLAVRRLAVWLSNVTGCSNQHHYYCMHGRSAAALNRLVLPALRMMRGLVVGTSLLTEDSAWLVTISPCLCNVLLEHAVIPEPSKR
jgi:hypothetical protein